jgi:hypothetical protein
MSSHRWKGKSTDNKGHEQIQRNESKVSVQNQTLCKFAGSEIVGDQNRALKRKKDLEV